MEDRFNNLLRLSLMKWETASCLAVVDTCLGAVHPGQLVLAEDPCHKCLHCKATGYAFGCGREGCQNLYFRVQDFLCTLPGWSHMQSNLIQMLCMGKLAAGGHVS